MVGFRDVLVQPRKGRRESFLPATAILVPNPAEADRGGLLAKARGWRQDELYASGLYIAQNRQLCFAGPALGGGAAGLVVEKLIVRGVKRIVLLSCCGAIDPQCPIGSIILAHGACRGEGVSQYYQPDTYIPTTADVNIRLLRLLGDNGLEGHGGAVWSTDAPYRERRSELLVLQERDGVLGVDMECAAIAAICRFRGISFGGLFVVSDELWGPVWRPGFSRPEFISRCDILLKALFDLDEGKEVA